MASTIPIEHKGTIESIDEGKHSVRFTSLSACGECHAKAYCSVSGMKEKKVEVENPTGRFNIGETVNIILTPSQGFEALRIGYVYPFFVVFSSLIVLSFTGIGELYAGLISLLWLFPYYFCVYRLRNKISKKFQFTIRKLK